MRILIASALFPPDRVGGAEEMAFLIARGLADRGHEVRVLTTGVEARGARQETRFGLPTTTVGHRNAYWSGDRWNRGVVGRMIWHSLDAFNPGIRAEVAPLFRGGARPDVVQTHQVAGLSPSLWIEARDRGIPAVHVLHDHHLLCVHADMLRGAGRICETPRAPCRARIAWFRALAARGLRGVVSPTLHVLERHRRFGFFRGIRQAVIPHGLPDPAGGAPPPPLPEGRPPVAGYMGALEGNKGILDFARAFAAGTLPGRGWVLQVAGTGSERPALEALAAANPCIRYRGVLSGAEKSRFLAELRVLVMPSRGLESFGLVLAEAAAMGRPVLASRRSASALELVENGKTGWVVSFEDPVEVEARIDSLRTDPGLWGAMSRRARDVFLGRFTLEACVSRHEAFLEECLRARGAGLTPGRT